MSRENLGEGTLLHHPLTPDSPPYPHSAATPPLLTTPQLPSHRVELDCSQIAASGSPLEKRFPEGPGNLGALALGVKLYPGSLARVPAQTGLAANMGVREGSPPVTS